MRLLASFLLGALLVSGLWIYSGRAGSAPDLVSGAPSAGIGETVAPFAWASIDDRAGTLTDLIADGPVVLAMRDVGCPVCRKYGHELGRLESEYGARGVNFVYLNVSDRDSKEAAQAEMELYGLTGTYILDHDELIQAAIRPETTTEVFVIDGEGVLRYRGAIDDQYGIDFTKPEPRNRYLRNALDAVLTGEQVAVASTFASGCFLADDMQTRMAMMEPITWNNRIAHIAQENCVTCHRDGGIGPFTLDNYENAFNYRGMIQYMVGEGRMPPWFADPAHGVFSNDRRLDAQQKLDIMTWIAAGAPEGDPADAPEPRSFTPGWQLGEPDAVIQVTEPFTVPAEGVVDYQYFYVKTDFAEDRWITSMEVRNSQPQLVHHVLVFEEAPDADRQSGGVDGYFAAIAPGFPGNIYPTRAAKLLPAGAWLKFQVHYTPNGQVAEDLTMLGLHFADGPPERVVQTRSAFNTRIQIPPFAADHQEVARHTFRQAGEVFSLFPHMHVRGKAFRYVMVHPDGAEEIILDVPRYDFNWQLAYHFSEPLRVQPGTQIIATAWYDNSEGNPANPDPSQTVYFGEQTFEEMMIGYFDWIPDTAPSTATTAEPQGIR